MKQKTKLDFMVANIYDIAYIPNPVRVKIINPGAIYLTGMLGESGRKLLKAGAYFYFTRKLADEHIKMGIAKEYKDDNLIKKIREPYKK